MAHRVLSVMAGGMTLEGLNEDFRDLLAQFSDAGDIADIARLRRIDQGE